ncbi:hypothetical protein ACPOL_0907 [Acidisarcina polymorpha]|uniref:Uncharacterized protein n=1 Tax=Acidisarcina polymorpha TaxID=2211140 RepID=A0A2Z5FUU9_9BACT|nr:hypothetical protein ACPOL_0907 [Acidisarcina polymorpha]
MALNLSGFLQAAALARGLEPSLAVVKWMKSLFIQPNIVVWMAKN